MRLAVIGGGFGRYGILPAFLAQPDVEITAVCTSRQETAEKFARQFNVPKAFSSWRDLLEENIDVLAIAAPPAIQAEITAAALTKKIPVFLEKQIAIDAKQSEHLLATANKHQVSTCVNFIFPSLHTWQTAHEYVSAGKLGKIRQVFLNWRMETYDNRLRNTDIWKTNDSQGGGVLQHFLSHSFHYLENFFGKISALKCLLMPSADLHTAGTTYASLDLIFSNNVMAHVAASSAAYAGTGHSLEIYGSEGSLVLKNEKQDPVAGFELFYTARGEQRMLIASEAQYLAGYTADSRVMPTSHLVKAFLKSLAGEKVTHPTLNDGHRVQQLISFSKLSNANQNLIQIT
jgi:predicted dehydrogenase